MLIWVSFSVLPIIGNTAQRLNLVGDPAVIFNRQQIEATFSNVFGDCNVTNYASFDPSRSTLIAQYQENDFVNDPICHQTLTNLHQMGYTPGMNSDLFKVLVDVRSLMTGLALSFGLLSFDQLVQVKGTEISLSVNGSLFNTSEFYDPQYPGMAPLYCITSGAKKGQQCVLSINRGIFAIPLFNHRGSSSIPTQCECQYITPQQLADRYYECNRFEFLLGFLFYQSSSVDKLFTLFSMYDKDIAQINYLAFDASYVASYWGQNSPYYSTFLNTPAQREKYYSFCRLPDGSNCSIVTFSAFDSLLGDYSINQNYFQLTNGACQDHITMSWENWYASKIFFSFIKD